MNQISFISCFISDNTSEHAGGGIEARSNANINVMNCVIYNNSGGSEGGGIDIYGATLQCMNNTFINNSLFISVLLSL